jgi:hypothetical protein
MISTLRWVGLVLAAGCSLVAGCGSDPCGASRPNLVDCEHGLFRADCGGTGPPTFACSEEGNGCRWFATQCVAAAYRATDCPPGNLCCHDRAGAPWLYTDDWSSLSGIYIAEMVEDAAAVGDAPVTNSAPITIEVAIDPAVPATSPSIVQCEVPAHRQFCMTRGFVPMASGAGGVALILNGGSISPEIVTIEIVPLEGGMLGARTFSRVSPDSGYAQSCARAQSTHLDIRGTMTLSSNDLSVPASLRGRADLTLNGGAITVQF